MRRWVIIFVSLFALGFSFVQVHGVMDSSPEVTDEVASVEEQEEPFVYDVAGIRDPFVPLIVPTEPPTPTALPPTPTPVGPTPTPTNTPVRLPAMSVQVIMNTNRNECLAVINGELVGPGDIVDDVKVLEVHQHQVVVEYLNVVFVVSPAEELEEAEQEMTAAKFDSKTKKRKGRRR